MTWKLYIDPSDYTYLERFEVVSWQDHLGHHHSRLTEADRLAEQAVAAILEGYPRVDHLFTVPWRPSPVGVPFAWVRRRRPTTVTGSVTAQLPLGRLTSTSRSSRNHRSRALGPAPWPSWRH